jgi:hypothetical protein
MDHEGGLEDDMAEDSLQTLYEALYVTLAGANVIWGNRVFPDQAGAKAPRPYVLYNQVSGSELNLTHNQDPEYTIQVKCVAGGGEAGQTMFTAMDGAAAISELLNDKGAQDRNDGTGLIVGDDDWEITTITQDIRVHLVDPFREAAPIYHEGHQFVIRMQRK